MSQRFYNSHALLNMAVYLPAADENVIDGVRVAIGHWDTTDMGNCRCRDDFLRIQDTRAGATHWSLICTAIEMSGGFFAANDFMKRLSLMC